MGMPEKVYVTYIYLLLFSALIFISQT